MSSSLFKKANLAMRERRYECALELYESAIIETPDLEEHINFNLLLCKKFIHQELSATKQAVVESSQKHTVSVPQGTSASGQVPREALPAPCFDIEWYHEKYGDIKRAGVDPAQHFNTKGWVEGRKPNAVFDTKWYLERYPDVAKAKINPLDHFNKKYKAESRDPSPLFSVAHYLKAYPDVAKAGVNPLQHYLKNGCKEGRRPHPEFRSLDKSPKYHDVYKTTLDALEIALLPQRPLIPKDEALVKNYSIVNSLGAKDIVASFQKASGNKIAIYAANIGCREEIPSAPNLPGVDFFVFTDRHGTKSKGWNLLPLDYFEVDPKRTALYYKTHPHLFFKDYDFIIWCDQNVTIRSLGGFDHFLKHDGKKIASFAHWGRSCLYKEGEAVIKSKRDTTENVWKQLSRYEKEGFPKEFGLFETNVIFERHLDSQVIEFNRLWWSQIVSGAKRDQLSFTYCLWKTNLECLHVEPKPITSRNSINFEYKFHG